MRAVRTRERAFRSADAIQKIFRSIRPKAIFPACGFTTEESNIVGGRQCKLLANEIDNSYFGLYRCEVTDAYGQNIISAEAKLSEKIPEQGTQNVE